MCYTSQNNFPLPRIPIQTFMFKKFFKRKPKTILDLYTDMMKKRLSYVNASMCLIMLSTLKLCGRANLQDWRNCHRLLEMATSVYWQWWLTLKKTDLMVLKRETVPTRKKGEENDSLHSLNTSKTGRKDLKEVCLERGNSPLLNVASNFRSKEQGFQHQSFHSLLYNLAMKIQKHNGTIVYILGLLRN